MLATSDGTDLQLLKKSCIEKYNVYVPAVTVVFAGAAHFESTLF